MSYAEDFGYDAYSWDDIKEWRNRQNYPKDENGIGHCINCGAIAKTSQAGNLYCANICWTKEATPHQPQRGDNRL